MVTAQMEYMKKALQVRLEYPNLFSILCLIWNQS